MGAFHNLLSFSVAIPLTGCLQEIEGIKNAMCLHYTYQEGLNSDTDNPQAAAIFLKQPSYLIRFSTDTGGKDVRKTRYGKPIVVYVAYLKVLCKGGKKKPLKQPKKDKREDDDVC